MRKYLFLLFALLAMQTVQGQIAFGPYLTYGGKSTDTVGQMTVQFGVQPDDTRTYYIVYWNTNADSTRVFCEPLVNFKTINTRRGEIDDATINTKYKIWWITLKGLAQGNKYRYFVSEYYDNDFYKRYASFQFTGKAQLTNNDLRYTTPVVVVKNTVFNGSLANTDREVFIIKGENSFGFSNFSLPTSNTIKISTIDNQRVYTFKVPKDNDTTVTCFLISDTQDVTGGNVTFPAMRDTLLHGLNASFILHGGDFGDWDQNSISKLSAHNQPPYSKMNNSYLFGSIPLQVTEGNHDRGYAQYGANSIVSTDNLINLKTVPQSYTKEMIWFDKYFQYNYDGLKSTIKPNAKSASIPDYYSHNYSFDWGPVHVAVLDFNLYEKYFTEMHFSYPDKQFKWLIDDLYRTDSINAKQNKKQWKIVLTHFSDAAMGTKVNIINYKGIVTTNNDPIVALNSILYHYKVHLVIDGHSHNFCDTCHPPTDDDFQFKIKPRYIDMLDTSKNRYLQMRVPVDASNFKPTVDQFSYFTLNFNGSKLTVKQFSGQNNETMNKPIRADRTFFLNKTYTITEK